MMTITATDVRLPRHHRRGLQPRVEHAALRPPHLPPARLRRQLPRRRARATGSTKRDLVSNINWFMNVPVGADGTLGIVDGISAPGLSRRPARRDRRARADLQLPADQQPVQRLRPDAGPRRRSRPARGDRRPAADDAEAAPVSRLEVLDGGPFTTVQDVPGRVGYWHVGVPPNGPMDDLVAPPRQPGGRQRRAAPRRSSSPAAGPTLRFTATAVVALGGAADAAATSTGVAVPPWAPVAVAGRRDRRRVGAVDGPGLRATLAVRGGIDVPSRTSGSRSTFTLGAFGGHEGRPLAAGDVLADRHATSTAAPAPLPPGMAPDARRTTGTLGVLVGPHAAPEFLTADGLDALLRADVGGALQLGAHRRAADRADARSGPGPTAARPACTRRTSTTPATPSARSTSPATCRSSSVPTGPASAASSARPWWRPPSAGSSGSSRPATRCAWCPWSRRGGRGADVRRAELARAGDRVRSSRSPGRRGTRRCAPDGRARRRGAGPRRRDRRRPPGGHLPPGRRPLPARRVRRRWRSTSSCGSASTRSTGGSREHLGDGVVDATAGRALAAACRSTATGSTVRRRARRAARGARTSSPTSVDAAVRRRGSCTCRCRGTTRRPARRSSATCTACAPTRRGARGTSSSSAASTASTTSTTSHRIVFDASYLVLGLGDVYLGAPVATPLDPAAPAGDHQVQPGPHLDRRRTPSASAAPTCASTAWRARAATSSSGARCRCGTAPRPGPHFERAVAAAPLRPAPLVPRSAPTSCSSCAREQAARRARRCDIEDDDVRAAPTTGAFLADARRRDRRRSGRASSAAFDGGAAARGPSRASSTTTSGRVTARPRPRRRRRRGLRARSRPTAAPASGSTLRRARTRPWRGPRRVDARRRRGRARCPLAGVTLAVKDNIDVAGLPHHRGLPGLRLPSRPTSAPVVARPRGGGRGGRRQDQPRPVRHRAGRHPLAVRRLSQRPLARARRRAGRARARPWRWRAGLRRPRPRHRHRRLRPGAGGRATASSGSSRRGAGISDHRRGARLPRRSTASRCSPVDVGHRRPGRRACRRPDADDPWSRPVRCDRARTARGSAVPRAGDARLRRRPVGARALRRRGAASWWPAPGRRWSTIDLRRRSSTPVACSTRGRSWPSATRRSGAFVDAHPDDVDPVVGPIIAAAGRLPAWQLFADLDRARARWATKPPRRGSTVDVLVVPTRAAPAHRGRGAWQRPDRRQLDARHLHELREPARPRRGDAARRPGRHRATADEPHPHRAGGLRRAPGRPGRSHRLMARPSPVGAPIACRSAGTRRRPISCRRQQLRGRPASRRARSRRGHRRGRTARR